MGLVRGPFSLHVEQQQETRGSDRPASKIPLDIRTQISKFTAPFPFPLKTVLKGTGEGRAEIISVLKQHLLFKSPLSSVSISSPVSNPVKGGGEKGAE